MFYYTKYMRLIKQFWHWINPSDHIQLLVLELDSANVDRLAQIAANSDVSR